MTSSLTEPSDAQLLAAQEALQAEADGVLRDLDLLPMLESVGRPVRTGSSALGVMVRRDIDVTTLCARLEPASIFDAMRRLSGHPNVRLLGFRNDTGRWNVDPAYPDGLYWRIQYRAEGGEEWNVDLWFLLEGTSQFDLEHIVTLPPRLTPDVRLSILRIKHAWQSRPEYGSTVRSYDIYEAVLDHGITTVEAFSSYLDKRRPS